MSAGRVPATGELVQPRGHDGTHVAELTVKGKPERAK